MSTRRPKTNTLVFNKAFVANSRLGSDNASLARRQNHVKRTIESIASMMDEFEEQANMLKSSQIKVQNNHCELAIKIREKFASSILQQAVRVWLASLRVKRLRAQRKIRIFAVKHHLRKKLNSSSNTIKFAIVSYVNRKRHAIHIEQSNATKRIQRWYRNIRRRTTILRRAVIIKISNSMIAPRISVAGSRARKVLIPSHIRHLRQFMKIVRQHQRQKM